MLAVLDSAMAIIVDSSYSSYQDEDGHQNNRK
jgi:hypothetical protein